MCAHAHVHMCPETGRERGKGKESESSSLSHLHLDHSRSLEHGEQRPPWSFCTALSNAEDTDLFSRELTRLPELHISQHSECWQTPISSWDTTSYCPSGGHPPLTADLHTDASIWHICNNHQLLKNLHNPGGSCVLSAGECSPSERTAPPKKGRWGRSDCRECFLKMRLDRNRLVGQAEEREERLSWTDSIKPGRGDCRGQGSAGLGGTPSSQGGPLHTFQPRLDDGGRQVVVAVHQADVSGGEADGEQGLDVLHWDRVCCWTICGNRSARWKWGNEQVTQTQACTCSPAEAWKLLTVQARPWAGGSPRKAALHSIRL